MLLGKENVAEQAFDLLLDIHGMDCETLRALEREREH